MFRAKPLPSAELLREWLAYEPKTGKIRWVKNPLGNSSLDLTGKTTGSYAKSKSYVILKFRKVTYSFHRIAWVLMTGEDPGGKMIDHLDGNPRNNRWSNLRLATALQNAWNAPAPRGGFSGIRGVEWTHKTKNWRVRLVVAGTRIDHGGFKTLAEAADVARKVRIDAHGEFANHIVRPPDEGVGIPDEAYWDRVIYAALMSLEGNEDSPKVRAPVKPEKVARPVVVRKSRPRLSSEALWGEIQAVAEKIGLNEVLPS